MVRKILAYIKKLLKRKQKTLFRKKKAARPSISRPILPETAPPLEARIKTEREWASAAYVKTLETIYEEEDAARKGDEPRPVVKYGPWI